MDQDRLVLVAYGDCVHVYPTEQRQVAELVYLTAIGANADAELFTLNPETWAKLSDRFSAEFEITDHREALTV
jgi:hypothetical protein